MFKTIILTPEALEELKMKRFSMPVMVKPKNANSKCKCGKIILDGEPVGSIGRDSLGRPKVICLNCRNK